MGAEPEALAGLGREVQLVDGPRGTGLWLATQFHRRELIEQAIERRVHRHQLALQMGRKFADFDAGLGAEPLELVAVGLAFGGASQVQALRSERWQLNPAIAERGRPARQVRQVVERRLRPEKLRKEDGRSTNGRTASTAGCRGLLH